MIDVVTRFLRHADRQPESIAVVDRGQTYTYRALRELAQELARSFCAMSDHPRILIMNEQGYISYAAMLATLMAGGIYAPVNMESPAVKIRSIASQFDPDIVVADTDQFRNILGSHIAEERLVDPTGNFRKSADVDLDNVVPHDLAYVMFTSGTTGVPKGVMVPRSALSHYVGWVIDVVRASPSDRWSQHPITAFDLSQFDIYGALCSGGCLYPFNTATDRMFPALAIRRHCITIWNSVPSIVNQMIRAKQLTAENLGSVRIMNFCGEALLPEHLDAIFTESPTVAVHNTYGPTEATVSCTFVHLTANNYKRYSKANVSIGEAIPGSEIHLLNGPTEDEGELVISGLQVARGYWRNPTQTANFFRNFVINGQEVFGYFTGDYARREEGNLYFAGRMDFQVKVRGKRLELMEVDAAIRKCGFAQVATVLIGEELHAFLETDRKSLDVLELRRSLAGLIEQHAVPSHFHLRQVLPLNANDKIDVKSLVASVVGLH